MKLLRHPVAALVVFAILTTLCVTIYGGFEEKYEIEDNYTDADGFNIMESLTNLHIIQGLNQTTSSVYKLKTPTATTADILGNLASAGIGVLKLIGGLLTFPFQITAIIVGFYSIPPVIVIGFSVILIIYISFLILSAYLRSDV